MFRKYREQGLLAPHDWWWLITPLAGTLSYVRFVRAVGTLDDNYAYYGTGGVRPALFVESEIEVELEEDEVNLSDLTLLKGFTTRQLVAELFWRICRKRRLSKMIMSRLLLRNDIFRTEIFSILGAQDAAEATKQPRTTKHITEQKRSP